jgi:hypothetical protein
MNDPWDPVVKFALIATAIYFLLHIVFAFHNLSV